MAAILEPHRLPASAGAPRPELRVLQGGRSARPAPARPLVTPGAIAAFVAVTVLLMVGFVAIGRGAFSAAAPATPAAATAPAAGARTVTVRAGDTLWSIARRLRPTGDVRPLVDQLAEANGGTAIAPGDRLVIPS
ncbi:LysM peptidoglycan-binding domain-containing protein [Aquihabitans sp. G128]|uniref:LysM peptidoglycan-binding domain-containing protein n=1 Tax=Aquihabitans sp. G128 TaxID=2849779 RepID=UPI001C24F187|nr:LysM domain-containing protein [Aquihabitans sp. G128]QXC62493.1 LysM peptidoglycan-binding domain-containing protein [Aquihabitans sp. G128]